MNYLQGNTMKRFYFTSLAFAAVCALAVSSQANVLVSNVWNTGARNYPSPTDVNSPYSENGVDYNASGDLESAWFSSNAASLTASAGHLIGAVPTGSLSMYTYFTATNTPVTLASIGDEMKLTWVFTPNTITQNASQGFNLALAQTPTGVRATADGSVPSANYTNGFACS
jgi:hypothetical protein